MYQQQQEDRRPEIDISVDLELDGSSIVLNSCLQLGVVAFYHHAGDVNPWVSDTSVVSRREWSTYPQEGKTANPECLEFLERDQPALLPYIKANAIDIRQCIGEFCQWYADLATRYKITVFVASPASIDYAWLTNLVAMYRPDWAEEVSFPYDCRCLKTMMNVATTTCRIDTWSPASVLHQHPYQHKHFAINDAEKQAYMYLKLRVLLRQHREQMRNIPPPYCQPLQVSFATFAFPLPVIEEDVTIADSEGEEIASESSSE